jgi:hypothetical protein
MYALFMTRKTLALVLPALLLVIALMAGTTMAMQVTKVKPDTPGTVIIKETIPLKLKTLPPLHRIDPALAPYSAVFIGPFYLSSSNQGIAVYITWSPSSATLFIGVMNAQTGSGFGTFASGGSAAYIFFPGAGYWYVLIYNDSPYYVTANVYIFIVSS